MSKHFYGAALMGAILFPVVIQGCSSSDSNPLCCTEFKVGGTLDANIGGSAQSKVAIQAVADFSGIASAAIDDITSACRGIATDLGADAGALSTAEANADPQAKMSAYCDLAVSSITTIKAQANLKVAIVVKPAVCEASFSAKADCSAKCSATGKCEGSPGQLPTCEGGTLNVECSGGCTATATAPSFHCEGSCDVKAEGSCTVKPGGSVKCSGKCNGTCKGSAQGGTGTGLKADGTCDGSCEGTCEVTAPDATCDGSFNGSCQGKCTASPGGASVKCDAKCDVEAKPLSCSGGKPPHIDCQVDAKCDANCDASVSAKAKCSPPEVSVDISGAADLAAAGKLKATLEANFGVIAAFKGRLDGMVQATGTFSANITAVTDIKPACIPPVVAAVKDGLANVGAAASATAKVAGSVSTGS